MATSISIRATPLAPPGYRRRDGVGRAQARRFNARFFRGILTLLFLVFIASPSHAANLLGNPGFEADDFGGGAALLGWQTYGANHYNESDNSLAHSGTNYFKVYQAFNGTVNFNGIYQDYISGSGATYAADGWAYTAAGDALAGQNAAWLEITFRDANANILALYRSALITANLINGGGFPKSQWTRLAVTNQYDINSFQITNHATQLTAPPGTYFVRCQIVFQGDANNSGGSVYFDDLNLVSTGTAPYGDMNIVWNDEFDGAVAGLGAETGAKRHHRGAQSEDDQDDQH